MHIWIYLHIYNNIFGYYNNYYYNFYTIENILKTKFKYNNICVITFEILYSPLNQTQRSKFFVIIYNKLCNAKNEITFAGMYLGYNIVIHTFIYRGIIYIYIYMHNCLQYKTYNVSKYTISLCHNET